MTCDTINTDRAIIEKVSKAMPGQIFFLQAKDTDSLSLACAQFNAEKKRRRPCKCKGTTLDTFYRHANGRTGQMCGGCLGGIKTR